MAQEMLNWIDLRGYYTCNLKLTWFVGYLKINTTFF